MSIVNNDLEYAGRVGAVYITNIFKNYDIMQKNDNY